MLTGFQHDIAGGNGNLIVLALKSPNFLTGVTGWQVRRDGSVEFNNGTFRGTISGGTLIISQGSGATFVQVKIDGATGITTWSKYQSPTVVIRTILANGTDLIYADPGSGNPQGALIYSNSPVSGTDQFSHAFKAGVTVYDTGGGTSFVEMIAGAPANVQIGTGDTAEATPAKIISGTAGSGATRALAASMAAPRVTGQSGTALAVVQAFSPSVDLTTSPAEVSITAADGLSHTSGLTVQPTQMTLATALTTITGKLTATGGTIGSPSLVSTDTWHIVGGAGEPAFGGGFGAAGGQQAPRFRLEPIGGGVVRLDGVVASTAATGAAAPMFQMPVGYRPTALKRFIVVNSAAGYAIGATGVATVVEVNTSGQVICFPTTSAAGQVIALEGLTFPVD